ncbi:hypothetical protein [Nocardioides marmorisolisilvae]|uniref:Uncharacterized protein n=1 Tax=Nocardioides marmorisolisilvae TaxID=1542737 RepID=A0A3N0E0N6_9ACTN|nr:hypothetical protein [Nocardioides marmorisolisilvae]RNL81418.1 hypothetical protein EFL95_03550 [Nocardioides marmorisolisilvae]
MNVEEIITAELREVGGAVLPPPPPDVAMLVGRARQDRARRAIRSGASVVLAAAVVLGVILLGAHLGNPKAAPPVPNPQPTGLPTGAPLAAYVDEIGHLHVDGVVEDGTDWVDNPTRFGDVTVAHSDADGNPVTLFLGGREVATLPTLFTNGEPEISPDHRTVAWGEPATGTGFIVVARLSSTGLTELGRLEVPALALDLDNEGHESLVGVTDDGTVSYGGIVGGHAWKPGGQPRDVNLPEFSDNTLPGFPRDAYDTLVSNPAGTWSAWLTDQIAPTAARNAVEWTTVGFQQPRKPETRVLITMPASEAHLQIVAWEDDTHLLLTVGEEETAYHVLRCDIETRTCEHAPMPPAS